MGSLVNKYSQSADVELDLHGLTVSEARKQFVSLFEDEKLKNKKVRIITGKGNHSAGGVAKIQAEVKDFLNKKGISWKYAKVNEGGEGAIEIVVE